MELFFLSTFVDENSRLKNEENFSFFFSENALGTMTIYRFSLDFNNRGFLVYKSKQK